MSRFNTGNPLGSGDPRDLDDNAKNMDLAVNSDESQWVDRFGRTRTTLSGYDARFSEFLVSSGYQFIGDYAPGVAVTEYNQLLRDADGEFWRLSGQVDLPYVTTGDGMPEDGAFVSVGDAVLREDLGDAGAVEGIVAYEPNLDYEMGAVGAIQAIVPAHEFNRHSLGIGVAQSSSVGTGGAWDYSRLDGLGFISSITSRNSGWLALGDTFQWVDVATPFGVIIGDSIAEGHGNPDRHGRLHTGGSPIYDLDLPNIPGQPSYYLGQKTNMYWYNHGIGGQTSAQVLARFERDALGLEVAVGDGRPDRTLPRSPYCVWINVGINDISGGIPVTDTMSNIMQMVRMCRDAGIVVGVNTCGPHSLHNASQIADQKRLQKFLMREVPKVGGFVFDFRTWFADPGNPDMPNPKLAADSVHPRGAGYLSYVSELIKQTGAPVVMQGLCIESKVDPDAIPTSYVPAKEIRVEHVSSGKDRIGRVTGDEALVPADFDMTNTKSLRVYVSEPDALPISGSVWTGISRVYGIFERGKIPEYGRKAYCTVRHSNATGWEILGTYQRRDIIDVSVISTTHLRVRFTRPVRNVSITTMGNSQPYSFSAGVTGDVSRELLVYVIDRTTGASVDPNSVTGNHFFSLTAE